MKVTLLSITPHALESEIPFIGKSVMNCGKTCNRCIEEII